LAQVCTPRPCRSLPSVSPCKSVQHDTDSETLLQDVGRANQRRACGCDGRRHKRV
jgi:hypothetical protein